VVLTFTQTAAVAWHTPQLFSVAVLSGKYLPAQSEHMSTKAAPVAILLPLLMFSVQSVLPDTVVMVKSVSGRQTLVCMLDSCTKASMLPRSVPSQAVI
jgi:hypothetical protein